MAVAPFLVDETHGIVTRSGDNHRLSSDAHRWSALYASAQRERPFEGHFAPVKDQLLVLHRSGPAQIERFEVGRPQLCTVPPGGVYLYPGGVPFAVRLLDELDTMHVYLRRSVIEEAAAELVVGDPASIEIPPEVSEADPILRSMLEAVYHTLADDDLGTSIYIDHLARAIAAHLIRRYSGSRLRNRPHARVGRDVARAVEFMHANMDQPITLDTLASVVGRSPSHIGRQFRKQLGTAPHSYLIEMRLERARSLLERTNLPVAAIAVDCGFSHQEHLTRFFRRRYGTTPAAHRRGCRH